MTAKVLFLCTGNYYRSRFAEMLFNHEAAKRGLDWIADSRALALEFGTGNIGPISSYTLARLQQMGVNVEAALRFPKQVEESDLQAADLIIALDRSEHESMVAKRLPAWRERIHYWEVADLYLRPADEALGQIATQVAALIDQCSVK